MDHPTDTPDVRVLTDDDAAAYGALIDQVSGSPLTHMWAYRTALAAGDWGTPRYFGWYEAGRLRAVLPAFVRRSAAGAVLNSLPLVQSAGDVVVDPALDADDQAALRTAFTAHILQLAAADDIRVCVFIAPPCGATPPALPAADFAIHRATHVLDLHQPLVLHHAAREALRRSLKVQPTLHVAHTEAEAQGVWQLYADSMAQLNVHARPWPFYARLWHAAPGDVRFVWSEVAGEATSGLLLLTHNDVVDYHFVGNTAAGRQHQTNTWLCVQELERAQQRGARWWNWGASPTPAVADFKKRFGGSDIPYTLRGYCTGDVAHWRTLTPAALAAQFPDYFVLPYAWLAEPGANAHA